MPRVPEIQRQQVDAPFPNVRVGAAPTADTYGGQIGDTAASAGVRFYDLMTRQANQTAVFEADRKLADKQTQLEQDMQQVQGKAALGLSASVLEQFDQHVQEAQDGTAEVPGLANPQQRGAFAHSAALRRQQLYDTVQRHTNQEFAKYQDGESKAGLNSVAARIRQQPGNPSVLTAEFTRAHQLYTDYADRKGLRPVVTKAMANDETFKKSYTDKQLPVPAIGDSLSSETYEQGLSDIYSGLHKEVIDGLLAQDQDQQAAAHLTKYRSTMTAKDLDAVEKSLDTGSTRGESRRQASQIMQTHGIETADQRRNAIKAVDAITNDKVADATRQRLEHEFSVFETRKNEDQSRRFELSAKVLDQQGLKRPDAVLEDLIPLKLLNTLDVKDRDALRLHLDRIRKPADHPHDPKAWFAFQSLTNRQMANVTPQVMMRDYLNHFDGTHYDRGLNDWNAARNLQEKGDEGQKYVSALSHRERIMNAWKDSGIVDNSIPVAKWTAEQDTWYHRFESEADKALSNLPKDAKPEELQKVLNGLSDTLLNQKFKVDPGFFSRNKQVPLIGIGDVKNARSITIPIAEIPEDRQDYWKGKLREAGLPITQENIEKLEAKDRIKKQGSR